jgi:hypothetical protein
LIADLIRSLRLRHPAKSGKREAGHSTTRNDKEAAMNGIKPSAIPLLVERDVARVREHAYAVITLDARGDFNIRLHPAHPGLSVIAVVGPGRHNGRKYREALLCEIGLCRGRPYAQANRPAAEVKTGEFRQIPRRRKWFWLTDAQYAVVAPQIFRMIGCLARKKVAGRRAGTVKNPFYIRTNTSFFSRHGKRIFRRDVNLPIVTGARFSFGYADRRLLADVLWAERNLNDAAIRRMNGLARYIGLNLSRYKPNRRTLGAGFWNLKHTEEAEKSIARARLLPHEQNWLIEALGSRAKEGGKRFLARIREKFGEPNPFFAGIERRTLPGEAARVNGTVLKVIRANGRYLTAEIFPQEEEGQTQ